jgi:hypothetical protein
MRWWAHLDFDPLTIIAVLLTLAYPRRVTRTDHKDERPSGEPPGRGSSLLWSSPPPEWPGSFLEGPYGVLHLRKAARSPTKLGLAQYANFTACPDTWSLQRPNKREDAAGTRGSVLRLGRRQRGLTPRAARGDRQPASHPRRRRERCRPPLAACPKCCTTVRTVDAGGLGAHSDELAAAGRVSKCERSLFRRGTVPGTRPI